MFSPGGQTYGPSCKTTKRRIKGKARPINRSHVPVPDSLTAKWCIGLSMGLLGMVSCRLPWVVVLAGTKRPSKRSALYADHKFKNVLTKFLDDRCVPINSQCRWQSALNPGNTELALHTSQKVFQLPCAKTDIIDLPVKMSHTAEPSENWPLGRLFIVVDV